MTLASVPGLRGRTLRSFLLLGAQKVIAIVVTAGGAIALARLLTPEVFGLSNPSNNPEGFERTGALQAAPVARIRASTDG